MSESGYVNARISYWRDGTIKRTSHRIMLSTPRFTVFKDAMYDQQNKRKDYYYLVKPNAVVVVPFRTGKILFLRVKRYLTQSVRYELPGGRMEKGDSPISAAKRELKEETGLTSTRWRDLGSTYPLPSVATERMYMFSAAIAPRAHFSLNASAREEGIISCAFLDFEHAWRIVTRNQVASPTDGFATLLFLRKSLEGIGAQAE